MGTAGETFLPGRASISEPHRLLGRWCPTGEGTRGWPSDRKNAKKAFPRA